LALADRFKTSQCQKLSERFEGLVKLDEGSCAVVYRAIALSDRREVAVKVVRVDDEEHLQTAWKEYNLLQQINHPSIIRALDFFTYASGAVLVEEFFAGKSLDVFVQKSEKGCMTEVVARQLFSRLIDAIAYLHKQGIIHRDVKAQNILISESMTDLRLVDFNASKNLADGGASLTMTGTPEYMPPEVLKGNSPSEASDVWASGLCFHYMLIGNLPSKCDGIHVQLNGPKWDMLSKPCKDILRKCMEPRQELRPRAEEILCYVLRQSQEEEENGLAREDV
jgi:cell division control protein CDC15